MAESQNKRPDAAASDTDALARVHPLGSLAFPEFRIVVLSFVAGFVGLQMRQVTNLWLVFDKTGDPLQLGLIGVFQFLPMLIFVFIGGSLADIVDRRLLLILTQTGNLVIAGVLALLALTGNIEVWHIYVATLVTAVVNTFEGPARMSMLPRLVPRTHLMNAITLNQTSRQTGMLLGPALAGLMIGLVGPGATYALVFVTMVPSVGALFLLSPMPPDPVAKKRGMSGGEMLQGFKFVFSSNIIVSLMLLDVVAMLFTHHRVLVPVFAEVVLNVSEFKFGLLMASPAVGFFIGSSALLLFGNVKRKGMLVLVTYVFYLGAITVFAMSRSYYLSIAAVVAIGGLDGVGAVMRTTILHLAVPDEIRGRATAVLQLSNRGGPSLGQVWLGALAASLSAPTALLIGAVVGALALVVVLIFARGVATHES